jgi:hypothetical protein
MFLQNNLLKIFDLNIDIKSKKIPTSNIGIKLKIFEAYINANDIKNVKSKKYDFLENIFLLQYKYDAYIPTIKR